MKVVRLQLKPSVTSLTMVLLVAIVCASLSSTATENSETIERSRRRIESNVLRTPSPTTTAILSSSSNENNESIEPSPTDDVVASPSTKANRRGGSSSLRRKSSPSLHPNSSSPSMFLQQLGVRPSSRHNIIHGSDSAVVIARMTYLKKEMCKSEPLEQVIKEPGCIRRRIVNRFCYGQCNSFFIPRVVVQPSDRRRKGVGGGGRRNRQGRRRLPKTELEEEEDDEAAVASSSFRSCSYCRPKTIEWDVVILQCPNSKTPIRRKRIPVVKQCACVALSFDRS